MSNQIKLGGQEATVVIEVHGYQDPLATDKLDSNWLFSTLTIRSGPFARTFDAGLMTDDLVFLARRLKDALASLSGKISFRSIEGDISFDIDFNKRGAATVTGSAEPKRSLGASLAFQFETDQSCLTETLHEIEHVLRQFPAKE